MADAQKTIQLRIDIKTDGEGKIKALGIAEEDLAKAIAFTTREADKARKAFSQWGSTSVMLNGITSCINNLNTVMQSLSAAYQMQEQNEMRLAQAMQNSMDATNEQIQAIKDLCSEQQKLGVIGDEVLLQGAQEMAMHLKNAYSLEMLIPVMNDVITQQYGIGASGEAAASVGKMLGKVMEGNTAPLKRLGITLSEADQQLLQYGDEATRAATLSSILEERFGGFAEAAGKTASGKLAQLNNALGDIKEGIGSAVNYVMPFVTGLAQLTMAGSGATSMIKGLTVSYQAYKKKADAATTSTKLFGASIKSVMIGTGIGAALVILGTVLESLMSSADGAADSLDHLKEAEEAGQREATIATMKIREQRDQLSELIKAHKDTGTAVQELNREYGDIFGTYRTAADWLDILSRKERDYAKLIAYRGKAQALVEKQVQLELEKEALQKDIDQGKNQFFQRKTVSKFSGAVSYDWYEKSGGFYVKSDAAEDYSKKVQKLSELNGEIGHIETELGNIETAQNAVLEGLKSNSDNVDFDAATASLETLGKEIEALKKKLREDFNSETINSQAAKDIQNRIKELESIQSSLETSAGLSKNASSKTIHPRSGNQAKDEVELNPDSAAFADQMVRDVQKRLETADIYDSVLVEELNQELNYWLAEQKKRRITIGLEVEPVRGDDYIDPDSIDYRRKMFNDAQSQLSQLKFDFANGLIEESDVENEINRINQILQGIGLEPLKLIVDVDSGSIDTEGEYMQRRLDAINKKMETFKEQAGAIGTLGNSFSQLGDAVGGSAGEILSLIGTMEQGVSQLLPQIMTLITAKESEAIASGTASAAQAPWFMVIPMIASVVGTIVGMFASLPKFAKGGIAYGPTLGLFGEYAGAANNPEVVAPLNTLTDLIKPENEGYGRVEFEIDGRKLRGVLQKVDRLSSRS